jgi:hypothetical protein
MGRARLRGSAPFSSLFFNKRHQHALPITVTIGHIMSHRLIEAPEMSASPSISDIEKLSAVMSLYALVPGLGYSSLREGQSLNQELVGQSNQLAPIPNDHLRPPGRLVRHAIFAHHLFLTLLHSLIVAVNSYLIIRSHA